MAEFKLYFSDLTEPAQKSILKAAGLKSEEDANWDCFPITTITFDVENEEV